MTEAWDGVPENPERDGAHWLWVSQATGALMAFQWHAPPGPDRVGAWVNISREITKSHPLDAVRMGLTYCAPCLTPAEVEARERAAWQRACGAMREAALETCRAVSKEVGDPEAYRGKDVPHSWREAWEHAAGGAGDCVDAIRALATPEFKP